MAISFIPNEPNRDKESLAQLSETFARIAMMREQNKAEKERLKIEQDRLKLQQAASAREDAEASRRSQADFAAGQAGIAELVMASAVDPSVRSMLMQVAPQTAINPQAIGQVAAQASFGGAPAPSNVAQMARPSFDARQVPVQQAAALAGQVRGFRQSEADLARTRSATSATDAQTSATLQAIEHEKALQPLRIQQAEAGIDSSRAAAAASRQQVRESEIRIQQIPLERARERQQQFTQFLQLSGGGEGGLAWASRAAYGTNTPPTMEQIIAEEQTFMQQAERIMSNTPPEQQSGVLQQLYNDRFRTRISQSVGMTAQDQAWVEERIAQIGNNPGRVLSAALEAVGQNNSVITEEDIPTLGAYLVLRYPGFRIPEKEAGAVRRFFQSLRVQQTAPGAAPAAAPAPADPAPGFRMLGQPPR